MSDCQIWLLNSNRDDDMSKPTELPCVQLCVMVSVLRQKLCWPARWILFAALLTSMGEAFQQTPIEGVTGEPILLTSGKGGTLEGIPEDQYSETQLGFAEDQYLKRVAPLVGKEIRNLLLMKKKPGGLSRNARFGYSFSLEREIRRVGWVLDGDEKEGYVLYLDLNANGDL